MDPDAPPLVKADTYAAQAEQLASRKAYSQAVIAHQEAARNFQLAAVATSETSAAKALLLQRDAQLRFAGEAQKKLSERGSSASAATRTNGARHPPNHAARERERMPALRAMPGSMVMPQNPAPQRLAMNLSSYNPRDRVDMSMMSDSRVSRKSTSPTASQISSIMPHSANDSGKSSSVEESYYLLKNDVRPWSADLTVYVLTLSAARSI